MLAAAVHATSPSLTITFSALQADSFQQGTVAHGTIQRVGRASVDPHG